MTSEARKRWPNEEFDYAPKHPVEFRDGSRRGQVLQLPTDVHHFQDRKTGEYWERINEAPSGQLASYFVLVTEGYRCPGWLERVRAEKQKAPVSEG